MYEPKLFNYQYFEITIKNGPYSFILLRTNKKTKKVEGYMAQKSWKEFPEDYFPTILKHEPGSKIVDIKYEIDYLDLLGRTNYLYKKQQDASLKTAWYDIPEEERQEWYIEIIKDKDEIERMAKIMDKEAKKKKKV